MHNVPMLVYNRNVSNYVYQEDDFDQEPPIETVISAADIKERVMDYLGAVLARCWYDKDLLCSLQINAHRALRHLGILLPDELDIFFEKKDKQRPKIIIYEWNQERTFRRKVCYLQMMMMAGR
jgi:hypothetical protein